MNRVDLIGRIANDIALNETANGKQYCRFTLAVDRGVKKEDGTKVADFISCVSWGKTAEIISTYVKKGQKIALSGRIQTGSYEKDGHRVWTTDVMVNEFEFVEKKEQAEPKSEEPKQEEWTEGLEVNTDDLPF